MYYLIGIKYIVNRVGGYYHPTQYNLLLLLLHDGHHQLDVLLLVLHLIILLAHILQLQPLLLGLDPP